jgi:outer membrane protein OmpA-like peptidoglycan-associated protein
MLRIRLRLPVRSLCVAAAAALLCGGPLWGSAALAQADGGLKDPPPAPTQCPDNMDAFGGSDEALTCICPEEAMARGSVWGTDTYTADSATCRAALHAGAAARRGGTVSLRMLPGRPRYPGTTRNGVQSNNYGSYAASFRFEGMSAAAAAPAPAPAAAAPEQCPDNMDSFAGSDEALACVCPPAQGGRGSVWGTDTYTADSATCRAAVHAGALSARGGPVTVEMLPGQARYPGTTRNGVQSNNYGAYGASFRVRAANAPRPAAAAPGQCPDNLTAYEGSVETLACVCPGELTLRGTVWGSGPYTADSATCRAAVHAGAIGVAGGTVTARMGPGEARYPGSTRNGVQSANFGAYGAGFRFEGAQQRAKDSAPVQAPVAESLRRSGQVQLYVVFRTGSADLDIGAAPVLGEVRDALLGDPALRLRLVGHTDTTGSAAVNRPLSVRRAEAVRNWLAANGVAPERLEAEGRGPDEPIADNATDAGRALNRRVQAAKLP